MDFAPPILSTLEAAAAGASTVVEECDKDQKERAERAEDGAHDLWRFGR